MFTLQQKKVTLVNPIKILPEEGKTTTMKEGETQQFRYELTQEAEEAGGTVKWRVQDSSILKVDENGFVTAVSAGKGKVSANYKLGNTTYNTYIDVTVEKVETECTISLKRNTVQRNESSGSCRTIKINRINERKI